MTTPHQRRPGRLSALIVGLLLGACPGCGNDLPTNGAQGNPVQIDEAKKQSQTISDYYKNNPKAIQRVDPSARR